jgi:hypothetical protein
VKRVSGGWQRQFDDPPSNYRTAARLTTLRDAADYITALPKKQAELPEWQAAIEALLQVTRGGPTMLARIGVMRALNPHAVREFKPSENKTHWGSGNSLRY